MILLYQLIHFDALLLGPANFELLFTIYLVSKKTLVNSFVMFFLAVNYFAPSFPRVVGHIVLFLCLSFAVPSTMRSLLLDYVVLGYIFGWISFLSRDVHKCNKLILDSNKESILSIALLGMVSHNSNNSTLPSSRIIAFELLLNGL